MNKYIFTVKPVMIDFKPVIQLQEFYEIKDFPFELDTESFNEKVKIDPSFFKVHTDAIEAMRNDQVTMHTISTDTDVLTKDDIVGLINASSTSNELEEFLKKTKL